MNNNNILMAKNETTTYEETLPIKIKSVNKILNEEYNLKQNIINPNESTPPNNWNKRLLERIGNSYEYKHLATVPENNETKKIN